MYDFVLIDVPAGLNDQSTKLLGLSDYVYVITVAEVAALRNVSQILEHSLQEEVPEDKVRVVLNRYDKRSPIPDAQIEKVIHRKIFWAVPNQYYQAVKVITDGDSGGNNSRSELMRNMKEWVDRILTSNVDTSTKIAPKKKRGLLGLFGEGN
jgi:pilus assembly protein CpaE